MKKALFILLNLLSMEFAFGQYLPLYDNIPNDLGMPNIETESIEENILIVINVSVPTYQYFRVSNDNVKRPCVVICPGGGYYLLAASHEGTDVAKYFNSIGINAIVLKYRIPNDNNQIDKSIAPLQDVQQAFYLARLNADKWGIDAHKVGVMGFSAGGHLAATMSSYFSDVKIHINPQINLRPDFQILIYPVITFKDFGHQESREQLIGKNPSTDEVNYFSNELQVNKNTPPAFIVHAKDDDVVPVKNALEYTKALKLHQVPVNLVLSDKGGHGFGMNNSKTLKQWPPLLKDWFVKMHIL
jgi:acetyl esterase/lipase